MNYYNENDPKAAAAGKQRGTSDERHLWPVFRDLIAALFIEASLESLTPLK